MILVNICSFACLYIFIIKKIINNIKIKEIYTGFGPITLSIRLKEIERIKLIEISDHPIETDMRNEHYPK